ncbi:MAG TPA: adenylate/guanylate cyclase domain-containing protein [Aeromicrobium sp.]|nr:adenylate/guanylate cyclase domain-containing protein [Aeromicrobium sp.]
MDATTHGIEDLLRIDRVWQWAWDRHAPRYSWGVFAVTCGVCFPIFATAALMVTEIEDSGRFLEALGIALFATVASMYLLQLPGLKPWRLIEGWAAGEPIDPLEALQSTYVWTRHVLRRGVGSFAVGGALTAVGVGTIADANPSRLVQYGIVGGTALAVVGVMAIHQFPEAFMRPARAAIAGDSAIGDGLPRARPSFATWLYVSVLGTAWIFALSGAVLAVAIGDVRSTPVLGLGIATGLTLVLAVPVTVGTSFAPSLLPIKDLRQGTERVARGDYSQRLPVVQDDDLGALAASFNRMQAGLAERERLQAAFGSYVDPALATRLLGQGDDVFAGERVEVTVMFVDVRDFTPFAEANQAEVAISQLNALFEIVVPAVLEAGGHVNKYLGDGALAVFGAPNALAHHADAAIVAALGIQGLVADRFQGALRIGVGINTGQVIAGTIGGGGKLEFTLIGDAVNVAARVEQLTKTTGDTILITQQTLDTLGERRTELVDRGSHELKGKSAPVRVYAVGPMQSLPGGPTMSD